MKFLYLFLLSVIYCDAFSKQSFEPRDIYFNVYRNDSPIGYHKLNFFTNEKETVANIEIKFEVTFLGFVVYDYFHKNVETWQNGELSKLDSKTDKNGDSLFCTLQNQGGTYKVIGSSGEKSSDSYLIPTSYWRMELVESNYKSTLNTQDCSVINFKISFLGEEKIYNDKLNTKHYKLVGKEQTGEDVIIDIWYDNNKNWAKMIFIKDGTEIEYKDKNFDVNHDQ